MNSKRPGSSENLAEMDSGKELIFQLGMERDMVIFEGSDMESLRELAAAFIESKVSSAYCLFV